MRTFGGSPRTARRESAYLSVGRASTGGMVLDVVEYGRGGKPYEAGVLLTANVRRELIRHLAEDLPGMTIVEEEQAR